MKLFDRLELQAPNDDGQPTAGEESGHAVARLFIRYSAFLFKMFSRTENGVRGVIVREILLTDGSNVQMQDDCMSEQTTFSQVSMVSRGRDLYIDSSSSPELVARTEICES